MSLCTAASPPQKKIAIFLRGGAAVAQATFETNDCRISGFPHYTPGFLGFRVILEGVYRSLHRTLGPFHSLKTLL